MHLEDDFAQDSSENGLYSQIFSRISPFTRKFRPNFSSTATNIAIVIAIAIHFAVMVIVVVTSMQQKRGDDGGKWDGSTASRLHGFVERIGGHHGGTEVNG